MKLVVFSHEDPTSSYRNKLLAVPYRDNVAIFKVYWWCHPELDLDRVHPGVGLGWVTKFSVLGWVGFSCQKYVISVQFAYKKPIIRWL